MIKANSINVQRVPKITNKKRRKRLNCLCALILNHERNRKGTANDYWPGNTVSAKACVCALRSAETRAR